MYYNKLNRIINCRKGYDTPALHKLCSTIFMWAVCAFHSYFEIVWLLAYIQLMVTFTSLLAAIIFYWPITPNGQNNCLTDKFVE